MKKFIKPAFYIIICVLLVVNLIVVLFLAKKNSKDEAIDSTLTTPVIEEQQSETEELVRVVSMTPESEMYVEYVKEIAPVDEPETEQVLPTGFDSYTSSIPTSPDISAIQEIDNMTLSGYKEAVNNIVYYLDLPETTFSIQEFDDESSPYGLEGFMFYNEEFQIYVKKDDSCINLIEYSGGDPQVYRAGEYLYSLLDKDIYSFMGTQKGFQIENYAFR